MREGMVGYRTLLAPGDGPAMSSACCSPTHAPALCRYGGYFCDAMGELHDKFEKAGATMCGYVSRDNYTLFDASKSLKGDLFVGLPLDEDNEDDQSEGRIDAWLAQLKSEGMEL